MEPKATAAVAAKNGTGLVGPVKGASGVYVIAVDNTNNDGNVDPISIRQRYENASMNSLGYLIPVLQSRVKIVDNRLLYF